MYMVTPNTYRGLRGNIQLFLINFLQTRRFVNYRVTSGHVCAGRYVTARARILATADAGAKMAAQREAELYVEEHHIMELLQTLSSLLLVHQPGGSGLLLGGPPPCDPDSVSRQAQGLPAGAAAPDEGLPAGGGPGQGPGPPGTPSVQGPGPGGVLWDPGPHQHRLHQLGPVQAWWGHTTLQYTTTHINTQHASKNNK